MSSTADALIAKAASQIGNYYNRPNGTSKYGKWYGDRVKNKSFYTAPYCAMFVSWCAAQVDATDIIPVHAYTPSGADWFKKRGQWHASAKRGDIVYFRWTGNRIHHVGIVEKVHSDGSVTTIEGNTAGSAGGSQRNGGVVARKRRKAGIVGFGRPKYAAKTTQPTSPTVVGIGDKGSAVLSIQQRLVAHGAFLEADGIFGPKTEVAVRAFRRWKGLGAGNSVNAATRGALDAAPVAVAQVRFAEFNCASRKPNWESRSKTLAKQISASGADVVFLAEFYSAEQPRFLKKIAGYSLATVNGGRAILILDRTMRKAPGVSGLPKKGNVGPHDKRVVGVKLENRGTGKLLNVVCAHFSWEHSKGASRKSEATGLLKWAAANYRENRTFFAGDFNAPYGAKGRADEVGPVMTAGGYRDAGDDTQVTELYRLLRTFVGKTSLVRRIRSSSTTGSDHPYHIIDLQFPK